MARFGLTAEKMRPASSGVVSRSMMPLDGGRVAHLRIPALGPGRDDFVEEDAQPFAGAMTVLRISRVYDRLSRVVDSLAIRRFQRAVVHRESHDLHAREFDDRLGRDVSCFDDDARAGRRSSRSAEGRHPTTGVPDTDPSRRRGPRRLRTSFL